MINEKCLLIQFSFVILCLSVLEKKGVYPEHLGVFCIVLSKAAYIKPFCEFVFVRVCVHVCITPQNVVRHLNQANHES